MWQLDARCAITSVCILSFFVRQSCKAANPIGLRWRCVCLQILTCSFVCHVCHALRKGAVNSTLCAMPELLVSRAAWDIALLMSVQEHDRSPA